MVVGYQDNGANSDLAIWRYNDTGSLDSTFGGTGIVTHDGAGGGTEEEGEGIALDSAGRILAAGTSGAGSAGAMVLWRFDTAGTLDGAFGSGGVATFDVPGETDRGRAIATDTAGRILVTGETTGTSTPGDPVMTIWAYDDTGALDLSFGSGGVVYQVSPLGLTARGNGIRVDSLGRIYVAGIARMAGDGMFLWRVDSSGNLDTTFGLGGFVSGSGGSGGCGVALDACGRATVTGGASGDMALWRYH